MPVSIATSRDPFRTTTGTNRNGKNVRPFPKLRVPQVRVLRVLMPTHANDPVSEWPVITRVMLAVLVGYCPTSGSITRVLNGIREGSSSGDAHPGLLALGMVQSLNMDIDGVSEVNFRITQYGIDNITAHIEKVGDKLLPVRDAALCVNDRYRCKE